jgi:hypothetical protein
LSEVASVIAQELEQVQYESHDLHGRRRLSSTAWARRARANAPIVDRAPPLNAFREARGLVCFADF